LAGGLGLVFKGGKEPRRTARVVVLRASGGHAPAVAARRASWLSNPADRSPALLVQLFGLGVVEDDVRWPAAFAHVVYRTVAACTRPAVVCALAISFRAEGGMRNGGLFSVGGALILHSAGVDVQRPGAMLQHIRRDRARQRLTGNDDRLERGLERSTPALPALGVVGGWGG